jgi:hypothetical protein
MHIESHSYRRLIFLTMQKPKPGEDVTVVQLGPSISIRIWDGDLACIQSFAFDLVNGRGQHIRTPKDTKIYSMPTELAPHAQVPFVEQSERAEAILSAPAHSFPHSPFIIDRNNDDPN